MNSNYLQKLILGILCMGIFSCTETTNSVKYSKETISKPTLFAEGIISTKTNSEFDLSFTPNGNSVYFTRRKESEPQKILVTNFENDTWSTPKITSFSTDRDEAPNFTPDGKKLYFGSARKIDGRESKGNFDMNIWFTEKENNKWNTPKPLDATINKVQQEGEEWPSSNENLLFTNDGKIFYYATMLRGSEGIGIYTITLENEKFSTPKRIEGLLDDEKYWKSSPTLSPDGNYLIFNAYGVPNGFGGEDIYVSKKTKNGWSKAVNLGNIINSKFEEGNAKFSRDGNYFFFSREDKTDSGTDGIWSIYYIETSYLQLDTLFN